MAEVKLASPSVAEEERDFYLGCLAHQVEVTEVFRKRAEHWHRAYWDLKNECDEREL